MSTQTESQEKPSVPTCKSCNSTDIYSDTLVGQTVNTKDVILMPIYICKKCEGGMIVAQGFKEFAKKVLQSNKNMSEKIINTNDQNKSS